MSDDNGKYDDPWLASDGDGNVPLYSTATPITVAKYDPDEPVVYAALDAVRCMSIVEEYGADGVATCRLRYSFNGYTPFGPSDFTQALADSFAGPGVIQSNDRITVHAMRTDGVWEPIFDGEAKSFEVRLHQGVEQVFVLCVGIAKRCWDQPIGGAVCRQGDDAENPDADVKTETTAHFNPKGRGNRIPGDKDTTWHNENGYQKYPTFLDPDHPDAETFLLNDGIRYLMYTENADEKYVKNPLGSDLDDLLVAKIPKDGEKFDPDDDSTYDIKTIEIPDKPITGKSWPNVVDELVTAAGFAMTWDLQAVDGLIGDGLAEPETSLLIFSPVAREPKSLYLQPAGSPLDLGLTNLGSAEIARDLTEAVNEWEVQGELDEWEASFVLACGFPCESDDGSTASTMRAFLKSDPSYSGENHDKYRLFVFDEAGIGHYAATSNAIDNTPPSLDALLGEPKTVEGNSVPQYVNRLRPPIGKLLTAVEGVPLKARLSISTDYTGDAPGLWTDGMEGAGTWQPIEGGYDLLKDRIGVRLNCENPNDWDIGKSTTSGHPFRSGKVHTIEAMSGSGTVFYLRLTCVVRGDKRMSGLADNKLNGPVDYPIRRVVDAHDRYKRQRVMKGSELYDDTATNLDPDDNPIIRDDSDYALAEAQTRQLVTLNGVFGGSVTIPRFTKYYEVGDPIGAIQGRGLQLNTSQSEYKGLEAVPVYPVVVGRQWLFEPVQHTRLLLSDGSKARASYVLRGLDWRRKHDASANV